MTSLHETFLESGKHYSVRLRETELTWCPDYHGARDDDILAIPTSQIISAWLCPKGKKSCSEPRSSSSYNSTRHVTPKTSLAQSQHPKYSVEITEVSETFSNTSTSINSNGFSERNNLQVQSNDLQSFDNLSASSSTSLLNSECLQNTSEPAILTIASDSLHQDTNPLNSHASPNVLSYPVASKSHFKCTHLSRGEFPALCIEYCYRIRPWSFLNACSSQPYNEDENIVLTKWQTRVIVFRHRRRDVIASWHDALWKAMTSRAERPRHLMVIINPMGGKKKAVRIYARSVEPLLQRAAIKTTVHHTRYCGHGKSLAEQAAMTQGVDGVVVVGGDGIVSEAVNGLMIAAAKRAEIDVNESNATLPESALRLGVIAAGSTDAYIHSLHGTNDVTTAALHIIMGIQRSVDVGTVHTNGAFDRFVMSGIHMGILGGSLETAVHLRKLGPIRNVISALKMLIQNRSRPYRMKVLVPKRPTTSPLDTPDCTASCHVCTSAQQDDQDECIWKDVCGHYTVLSSCLVSLENKYLKYGGAPAAHIGDGFTDIFMLPKVSYWALLSFCYKLGRTGTHLHFPGVQSLRAKEVHFVEIEPSNPINYDGELDYSTSFVFKVHRQRVQVFCRGRELLSNVKQAETA